MCRQCYLAGKRRSQARFNGEERRCRRESSDDRGCGAHCDAHGDGCDSSTSIAGHHGHDGGATRLRCLCGLRRLGRATGGDSRGLKSDCGARVDQRHCCLKMMGYLRMIELPSLLKKGRLASVVS